MYNKLQSLYQALDASVPKYDVASSMQINIDSEVSPECRSLFTHLVEMKQIKLHHNVYGIPVIRDTTIPVNINLEQKSFITTRYGHLLIPVPVIQ